jgi:prepilin peptidase CpaA
MTATLDTKPMTALATFKLLALMAMLGVAVVTDLSDRRIPNWLTVSGVFMALALTGLDAGAVPAASLLGMTTALAVTVPFFALGVLGAGDAKLLAAVGAFVGPAGLLPVLLYSGVAGGLMGLAVAVRRGVIIPILLQTRGVLVHTVTLGRHGHRTTIEDPDAQTIPYGVAIAAGTVAAWFFPLSLGVTP